MIDIDSIVNAIHFDFHNMGGARDVALDFDARSTVAQLKAIGAEQITFFAKDCNGFAYYPTEVGTSHPNLRKNILGELAHECRKEGVRLVVYFNIGNDNVAGLKHREWCKQDSAGRVTPAMDFYDSEKAGYYLRNMCGNTPYADYMKNMVLEVIDKYPLDGIFLDCYNVLPCFGHECITEMREKSIDCNDLSQVISFARETAFELARKIEDAIKKVNPEIIVYHNNIRYRDQEKHIEIEVLPNGGWGHEYLPAAIKYSIGVGKRIFVMSGRFHNHWGDICGLRPEACLLADFYQGIAHGGYCMIGDHFPHRGSLHPEVAEFERRILMAVEPVERLLGEHKALYEIAILDPFMGFFPECGFEDGKLDIRLRPRLQGAVRILNELRQQFIVIDGIDEIPASCRMLIIPDRAELGKELIDKINSFIRKGGKVITSGNAGIVDGRFILEAFKDFSIDGKEEAFYNYLARDSKAMPVANYCRGGVRLSAYNPKVRRMAILYPPEFNRDSFDGEFLNFYVAPDIDSPQIGIAMTENAMHIGIPFFAGYFSDSQYKMRELFGSILAEFLLEPMVMVDNFPSFGTVILSRSEGFLNVHLINYAVQKKGNSEFAEDALFGRMVEIRVRRDLFKNTPRHALQYSCENTSLEVTEEANYYTIIVPEMCGYELLRIENDLDMV